MAVDQIRNVVVPWFVLRGHHVISWGREIFPSIANKNSRSRDQNVAHAKGYTRCEIKQKDLYLPPFTGDAIARTTFTGDATARTTMARAMMAKP